MSTWIKRIVVASVMSVVAFVAEAAPSDVWVDDDYTPVSCDGHTWNSDAFTNIQAGVDAVAASGTVNVAEGIYTEAITIDTAKVTTLQGAGNATTIIQPPAGSNAITISSITAQSLTLKDIQLALSGVGRGINAAGDMSSTTIAFENAIINFSQTGRGISFWCYGGTGNNAITLLNSQLNCIDADGGSDQANRGISYNSDSSSLTLNNSTVTAGHYAINMLGDGCIVTISNGSILTGYAALNLITTSSIINVDNSTLTGRTFWSGDHWNTFGAIAFYAGLSSSNTVNITNSIITNQWVGGAKSFEALIIATGDTDNNKVYLDAATQLINANLTNAPISVIADDSDFEWYINNVLQENPERYNIYVDGAFGDDANTGIPGLPLKTIQAAIAEASSGETVQVAAGTYVENVVIDVPNLTLQSTDGRDLTIIDNPTVGSETFGIAVLANMGTVTVDGFTANNFRNGICQSSTQSEGTAFAVKNCKVIPENNSTAPYLRNGIQVSGDGSQVIGNYVVGAPLTATYASTAIGVVNASHVLVQGNTVDAAAEIGISILNYSSDIVDDITVVSNDVNGATTGIKIAGTDNTFNVQDVFIRDNDLLNSSSYGINIQLVTLSNLTVTANTITGSGSVGIRSSKTSAILAGDILINENDLSGNTSYGIYYGSISTVDATLTLTGNSITGNGWAGVISYSSSTILANENDLSGNTYYGIYNGTATTVDGTSNWWGAADGPRYQGPGSGDGINTTNVTFNPWYNTEAKTTKTYLVGSGQTYDTIQVAVDAASAGDLINVAAGTYVESNITIDKSLTILGENRDTVILAPAAEDVGAFASTFAETYQQGFMILADDVTIRSLTIDGDANNIGNGGTLPDHHNFRNGILNYSADEDGFNNVEIDNVKIANIRNRGINFYDATQSTHGHKVTDCEIYNIGGKQGISCSGYDVTISENTLHGMGAGIGLYPNVADSSPATCIVTNNILYDIAGSYSEYYGHNWPSYAIYFRNPNVDKTFVCRGNDIIIGDGDEEPGMPGVLGIYCYNADASSVIADNSINSVGGMSNWGVYLGGCAGTTVEGNTFTMNEADSGIYLGRGSPDTPVPNVIQGNVFESTGSTSGSIEEGCAIVQGNHGDLFWMTELPQNTASIISGNTIEGFVRGVLLHYSEEGSYASVGATVEATIADNQISGNTYGVDASTLQAAVMGIANWWGAADGPGGEGTGAGDGVSVEVTFSPWWADAAMTQLRYAADSTFAEDMTVGPGEIVIAGGTLSVSNGATVTVNNGTLRADSFVLEADASIVVIDGELQLTGANGEPTLLAGTFTIFDSWGSVYFDADTELSGDTIALVSHLVFADGVELAVSGSLTLDGCVLEAEAAGSYSVVVSNSASLKMVRNEVFDCSSFTVATGDALIKDNFFENGLVIAAAADGAEVFHNVFTDVADLVDEGVNTVLSADDWGNISAADATQNNLSLNLADADANGDIFIQPGDAVAVTMDLDSLAVPVSGLDALMGYNTRFLGDTGTVSVTGAEAPWTVDIYEGLGTSSLGSEDAVYGLIDKSIDVDLTAPLAGTTNDAITLLLDFTATAEEGVTKVFFRVAVDGDVLADTQLNSNPTGTNDVYISPFTMNSGYITVDGTAPLSTLFLGIEARGETAVDVFDSEVVTEQGTVVIRMGVTDELSGLDAANAVLTITNQVSGTALASSMMSTHTAGEMATTSDWQVVIGPAVENGIYDVTAVMEDRSGNAVTNTATLEVNKTTLGITVELVYATDAVFERDVQFVLMGESDVLIAEWAELVSFSNATATVSLTQVPAGVVSVSADTDWTLRAKQDVNYDTNEQGTAALPLVGGDLNHDNLVDMLDFTRLRFFYQSTAPEADINCDGGVNILDYSIIRQNWQQTGE